MTKRSNERCRESEKLLDASESIILVAHNALETVETFLLVAVYSVQVEASSIPCVPRAYVLIYRQQLSLLLYSIDIWPARISRQTQRETNH